MNYNRDTKLKIIAAGKIAIEQLLDIAKEKPVFITKKVEGKEDDEQGLNATALKNAAATKKIAIFDAFEILNKIEMESESLEREESGDDIDSSGKGFAERNSRRKQPI